MRQYEGEKAEARREFLKNDIKNTEAVAKNLVKSRDHLWNDFKKTRCRYVISGTTLKTAGVVKTKSQCECFECIFGYR